MARTIALALLLAACALAGCTDADTQSTEGGSTTPRPWTPEGNGTFGGSGTNSTTSATMTTTYPG